MIGDTDVLEQLMNKQARGASALLNCVHSLKRAQGSTRQTVQQVLQKWQVYKARILCL